MSLLMDALKKAEQEKKEAAKRQQEIEQEPQAENPQTAAELDATNTWEHEIVDGSTTAEIPAAAGKRSTTSELELEPIARAKVDADNTAEIPKLDSAAEDAEDPTLNVTMNQLTLAELSSDRLDADALEQARTSLNDLQSDDADLLDETFHGLSPDITEINPELFQETLQGEPYLPDDEASQTWGETLPGVPAALLARDIGGKDQPTPVAAQTVFAATGTTQASAVRSKWLFAGLASIVLVGLIIAYFYAITPENRTLLSPQIAQGIEHVGPPLHETLDIKVRQASETMAALPDAASMEKSLSGELSTENEVAASELPASAEEIAAYEARESGAEAVVAEAAAGKAAEQAEAQNAVATPPATETAVKTPATTTSSPAPAVASLSDNIMPAPALIKISRSKTAGNKGQSVREAYAAYRNGDYELAARRYQESLQVFPDNRDALLGLGAIAANKGDYATAYKSYARLLKINPRDPYAKAALINMQDNSVLAKSESTINSMLHDNPESHFLYFTLGNIYAASSRWSQAQQAFFDAYRLKSTSPDYALNLAVSLDHIGQNTAALKYYNVALTLMADGPSTFDSSAVRKRIDDLNKVTEH